MRFVNHSQIHQPLPVIGVGAMPFTSNQIHDDAAAGVWHHAFDLGMNLINTADCYAPSAETFGANEVLVGKAVSAYPAGRDKVFVVTKNGITRRGTEWPRDNSPAYLKAAAERSNERLGFTPDAILIHRLNRTQDFAKAVEALCEVRESGLTKHIGVSNVSRAELDLAWEVSGGTIAFVENERSPRYREHTDVFEACNERGIAFLAWSPLGGGDDAARLGEIHPAFAEVANTHGVSPQQVALAWLLGQGTSMLPIPAFRRIQTAEDSAKAADLVLAENEIAALNAGYNSLGSLYPD